MGKNTGKLREFCRSGKVGTMVRHLNHYTRKFSVCLCET